jgi:hypothetical protein
MHCITGGLTSIRWLPFQCHCNSKTPGVKDPDSMQTSYEQGIITRTTAVFTTYKKTGTTYKTGHNFDLIIYWRTQAPPRAAHPEIVMSPTRNT